MVGLIAFITCVTSVESTVKVPPTGSTRDVGSSDAVNNALVQEVPGITRMHQPQSFRLYDEHEVVSPLLAF